MIAELFFLLTSLSTEQYVPECNQEAADRGIQQEMNICAHRDYLSADEKLNEQWKLTSAIMKARDERWQPEWDDRPGNFASLLEAQRAWIVFRDAHCRVDGYTARGGSMEPLLVATCKTALTEARTAQLQELVDGPA